MAARWMQAKKRQRRAYLKKAPAAAYAPGVLNGIYGHNPDAWKPDALDDIETNRKIQRALIRQQIAKQEKPPRQTVKPDTWYRISLVNWPDLQQEMWFSGRKYFIREVRHGVVRKTSIYPSKESLLSDFRAGIVVWAAQQRSTES